MRKWLASYERLLSDSEGEQANSFEEEFLNSAKEKLIESDGFHNVKFERFERSRRILSIDVEFDHPDKCSLA